MATLVGVPVNGTDRLLLPSRTWRHTEIELAGVELLKDLDEKSQASGWLLVHVQQGVRPSRRRGHWCHDGLWTPTKRSPTTPHWTSVSMAMSRSPSRPT